MIYRSADVRSKNSAHKLFERTANMSIYHFANEYFLYFIKKTAAPAMPCHASARGQTDSLLLVIAIAQNIEIF
jgi:hypothetical protein